MFKSTISCFNFVQVCYEAEHALKVCESMDEDVGETRHCIMSQYGPLTRTCTHIRTQSPSMLTIYGPRRDAIREYTCYQSDQYLVVSLIGGTIRRSL